MSEQHVYHEEQTERLAAIYTAPATVDRRQRMISPLDDAISELKRALRPGERAALISTDWKSTAWHSTDPERMDWVTDAGGPSCGF